MAEFDVARLITILGARFEPTGFAQFDRAMEKAAKEAGLLRTELTKGYSTAALRDYELEIEKAERSLEKLRKKGAEVREVQTSRGVRYQRPPGHERAGRFISAETAANEYRKYESSVAKLERRIYALGLASEATSNKVEKLAVAEERTAMASERAGNRMAQAFDKVKMGLASIEVAAGEASFKFEELSAAEIEHLTKVAMARERSTIAFENTTAKVVKGYEAQVAAAGHAAERSAYALRGRAAGGAVPEIGRPSPAILAKAREDLAPLNAQMRLLTLRANALSKALQLPDAFVGGIEQAQAMELELIKIKAELVTIQKMALEPRGVIETAAAFKDLDSAASSAKKSLHEMTRQEREAELQARKTAHQHSQLTHTVRELVGFLALTFGAEQIFEQVKKTQEAANLFQETQARLRIALKNAGISWEEYEKRIELTTKALRNQTGFTDFEIQDSLANAIRAVGKAGTAAQRYAKAWQVVQSALDIARTKHIGLAQATSIVARAAGGYTLGLTRLGIVVEKTTTAQDKVRKSMRDHTHEFSNWRGEFGKWVSDQLTLLHHNRANVFAIKAFTDAAKGIVAEKKRELDATHENERMELRHAKAIDRAQNAQKALQLVTQAFAGQAAAYGRTLSGAWARFKASIDATRESTSNELLPALTKVVDYMTSHVVERVGTEINKLNDLWINMAHSVRDIALSALPAMQGSMEVLIATVKTLFAVLAPALGMLRDLVETVGGDNLGVFVASAWGASKALKVLTEATKAWRVQMVLAGALNAWQAFREAPTLLAGVSAGFREIGKAIAAISPTLRVVTVLAIVIGAVATAMYLASKQSSLLQQEDGRLRDSLQKNADAFTNEMHAIDNVRNSVLALQDAKLALKDVDAQITIKTRERNRYLKAMRDLERGGVTRAERPLYDELHKRVHDTNSELEHLQSTRRHDIQLIKESRDANKKATDDLVAQRKRVHEVQKAATRDIVQAFRIPGLSSAQQRQLRQWVERQDATRPIGTHPSGIHFDGGGFVRGAQTTDAQWQSFLRQRRAVVGRVPGDTATITAIQQRIMDLIRQHPGELSGSYRLGLDTVLRMTRSPFQARTLTPSRVATLLGHGDIAATIPSLQQSLGRGVTRQEFQFLLSHSSRRDLAAIVEFTKTHGRIPSKHQMQIEVSHTSVVKAMAVFNRLVRAIHNPKVNAEIDPDNIRKASKAIPAILQQGLDQFPLKVNFELPDGTNVNQWIKTHPTITSARNPQSTGTQPVGGTIDAGVRKAGGPIRRPTLALMGEEAPRYIEYVFSTNPRDRGPNMGAFRQLAQTYGLDVTARARGTTEPIPGRSPTEQASAIGAGKPPLPPGSTYGDPEIKRLRALLAAALKGAKGPTTPTIKTGASPLERFQADLQADQDAYTAASTALDLRMAMAERTTSTTDDARVSQAIIRLEQGRLNTIRRELRDPRFHSFTTSGTAADRSTAVQLRNSLIAEQATLYRDITTRLQQGPSVDLEKVLSPREQYQLAEATRTGNTKAQHRILTNELARLERMRRKAASSKQWALAAQISGREADVSQQLQSLGPAQAGAAYLEQLRAEAAELLSPAGFFQREVRGARAARTGHYSGVPAAPLAPMASGVVSVVNINTLHPGDPRTLREIHRANGSATAQAPHRRNPRMHVYG